MNETFPMMEMTLQPPDNTIFWKPGLRLQVQTVLYNNEVDAVRRMVNSLARATDLAIVSGACDNVKLRFGDSSSGPCLNDEVLNALRVAHAGVLTIEYDYFNDNLGSALGHNRLAKQADVDMILVQNPDIVVSPQLVGHLLNCFRRKNVGMAEAKQVPIEHPKDYDSITGKTSWATTACAMIPMPLFRQVGGFDADSFFLYCDDVDFSWMVREAGYDVIFQPAAIAFHDKRLSKIGAWQPSFAERYYSAEASLFMAHKWSRPDLLKAYLDHFIASGDESLLKVANTFCDREKAGTLPPPRDTEHKIGQFDGHFYTEHRYSL